MKALTKILPIALAVLALPCAVMASSATSEVHTVISSSGGGTSVVDVQTSTNGEVHTEHIVNAIPSNGTVEFNYATSSYSAGSNTKGNSQAHVGATIRVGDHSYLYSSGGATGTQYMTGSSTKRGTAGGTNEIHVYSSGTSTAAFHALANLPGISARFHQSFFVLSNILGSIFSWLSW